MAVRAAVERIREKRARLRRTKYRVFRIRYDVYERDPNAPRKTDTPCRLVRSIRDPHMVVMNLHAPKGRRRLESWKLRRGSKAERRFRELVAEAQPLGTPGAKVWLCEIVLSCSEKTLPMIQAEGVGLAVRNGGWRAGKTYCALQQTARLILHRGGDGRRAWLLGPQYEQCFNTYKTLFVGGSDGPAIFPTYLDENGVRQSCIADRLIATKAQMYQRPEFGLVDGTLVQFKRAQPTDVEGVPADVVHFDEYTRVADPEVFTIVKTRVAQKHGMVILSAIPGFEDDAWWPYDMIFGPHEAGELDNAVVDTIPTDANVFIDEYAIDEVRAACEKEGEICVQARFKGKWTRNHATAYSGAWDPGIMAPLANAGVMRGLSGTELAHAWGFKHDVTAQAAMRLFPKAAARLRRIEWLCGRDFNLLQTGLVMKVFADRPRETCSWTIVVFDEHVMTGDGRQAARAFSKYFRNGLYAGKTAIVCDANGWGDHSYYGGKSVTNDAQEFRKAKFPIRGPELAKKANKRRWKNPLFSERKKLVRKLLEESRILVDGQVCTNLIAAIPQVRLGEDRKRDKRTKLDSTVYCWDECLGYPVWALFSDELPQPKQPETGVSW